MIPLLIAAAITGPPATCHKTFTVEMGERASRAVYRGHRRVTRRERLMITRIIRCQRNPNHRRYLQRFNARQAAAHRHRVWEAAHPFSYATASWYQDAGATACGFHAGMGVANRSLRCGTRVEFRYGNHDAIAVVDDRGPYIAGRDWDLNQNTASALGFAGVEQVAYRIR